MQCPWEVEKPGILDHFSVIRNSLMRGVFSLAFFKVVNIPKYSSCEKSRQTFSSYIAGRATPLELVIVIFVIQKL